MQRRLPYRMQSGSWQPARLRWIDHAVLMIGLIVIAFLRGVDYLIGDDTWGARDFMIAAAPEWVWGGVGFISGALILAFGVATSRHLAVYVGHGWLFASYALNSLALIMASGPDYALPIVVASAFVIFIVARSAHYLVEHGKGSTAFLMIAAVVILFGTALQYSNHWDGIRGGGSVGLVAYIHLTHMIRTGGRPLRVEGAHTEETVVGGDAG